MQMIDLYLMNIFFNLFSNLIIGNKTKQNIKIIDITFSMYFFPCYI